MTAPTTPWTPIDRLPPGTRVHLPATAGGYAGVKPTVDLVAAVVFLIPALPLMAFAWLLVKLTSRGPGFYTQIRSGAGGAGYPILKVRTMTYNCEALSGILWSQKGDSRITPVGKFLRLSHLDELPQLFNVLRGEMSLVGPRPERPEVIAGKGLAENVPGYRQRLTVKPGVTGLAQIQLPADSDITSVRRKVVYDLYYITHQSLWLDLRIVAATAMKTTGMGPTWLRRLFFLPSLEAVTESFLGQLSVPPAAGPAPSATQLQPV